MEKKQLVIIVVGVGLILVYMLSLFAFPRQSSVRSSTQLPKDNVLDYRLGDQLKNAFIYYGSTILTFEYNSNCNNCFEQKGFLENMANQFKQVVASDSKNQVFSIYLEELINETVEPSKLTIESKLGNRTLTNPTQNESFDTICDLMFAPPIICAAR